MNKNTRLIESFTGDMLYEVLDQCSQQPSVRKEVLKNHDDNLWWPKSVVDWRLRMILAGWSTRISYNMVSTYQAVVSSANRFGYERLAILSDKDLYELVSPLGLFNARREYLRSICSFITSLEAKQLEPKQLENDTLIELIASDVKGASYKVAQCAALYAKGYHCGIFPVDSGMRTILGRCLGIDLPKRPIAHEQMRYRMEGLLNERPNIYRELAITNGYSQLSLPDNLAPIWWAHLVLIYFKRLYCNKKKPNNCPLKDRHKVSRCLGAMCHPETPSPGGHRYALLEGVDRAGKTTIANLLETVGYNIVHSQYKPDHTDIEQHYSGLFKNAIEPTVFDRSFISEIPYGKTLRGGSRLSSGAFRRLLELLALKGSVVIFINEPSDLIKERLLDERIDHGNLLSNLDELIASYQSCMKDISKFLPVYQIRPSNFPKRDLLVNILQIIRPCVQS